MKRIILTTFLAWLFFLMLDFLAHAVFLRSLWAQDFQAIKSKIELFRLVRVFESSAPFGVSGKPRLFC
jgi:hypothetical protein